MTPKTPKKKNYTVGYGKPPVNFQFQPGCSGNRRGRPKGSKNVMTYLLEEANAPVTLNTGDAVIKIPRQQALVKTAMNKALRGDMRAIIWVMAHLLNAEQNTPQQATMSEEDREILNLYLKRNQGV